jgi:hypothetical protein
VSKGQARWFPSATGVAIIIASLACSTNEAIDFIFRWVSFAGLN